MNYLKKITALKKILAGNKAETENKLEYEKLLKEVNDAEIQKEAAEIKTLDAMAADAAKLITDKETADKKDKTQKDYIAKKTAEILAKGTENTNKQETEKGENIEIYDLNNQ